MNNLESKLVQLYDHIHRMEGSNQKPSELLLQQAKQLMATARFNQPSTNLDVSNNVQAVDQPKSTPGAEQPVEQPKKPAVEEHPNPETIPPPPVNANTSLISDSYQATNDDYYLGINSDKPISIVLPEFPTDGKIMVIKSEMKPPMGNRKITIVGSNKQLIDGYDSRSIAVSHDSLTVIFRGDQWHTIR